MELRKEQGNVIRRERFSHFTFLTFLVLAAASLGALPTGKAVAQSTTASIHGQAPAGDVIVATSTTGFRHHTTVKKNGKYAMRSLPLGTYSVKLTRNGKVLDLYHRVPLMVSGTRILNFACPHDDCAAKDESSS